MSNAQNSFSESGNSPPQWKPSDASEHWTMPPGMPEFIAKDKRPRFILRINFQGLLAYDRKKQAFVTVQFRESEPTEYLSEISKRLQTYVSVETKIIELNTGAQTVREAEARLAEMLFDVAREVGHHAVWYPWLKNKNHSKWAYRQATGAPPVNPEYPIYVISKGRWDGIPLTCRALERMGCPYTLVVESQ